MKSRFQKTGLRKIAISLVGLAWITQGFSEHRVALVIGNSGYRDDAKLTNPENDAKAMHKELTALDFKVNLVLDADRQEMNRALGLFIQSLEKNTLAIFYFAGHGFQVEGANYLLPLKADADDLYVAKNNSVALNQVFDAFRSANTKLNVVILDCCRDNPFTNQKLARSVRSFSRGLADQAPPPGTIITFSTSAGDTASDGEGGNSPFTRALTGELARRPEDGLLLSAALRNTAKIVFKATGQDPILNIPGSADELYLFGGEAVPANKGRDNQIALTQASLMKQIAEMNGKLAELQKEKAGNTSSTGKTAIPPVPRDTQTEVINEMLELIKVQRQALERNGNMEVEKRQQDLEVRIAELQAQLAMDQTKAPRGSAQQAVRDYYSAINRRDLNAAYQLRSFSLREGMSLSQFRNLFASTETSVIRSLKPVLEDSHSAKVHISVDVQSAGSWSNWSGVIGLLRESGEWRIDNMKGLRQ